jgi:glycerophosphoryl diester phosphodiesterase
MSAFRRAAEQGARMIEFDVRLSRDGQVMVFHDEELGRTTDGRGTVETSTAAELRALDVGAWFSPQFSGERMPLLSEVIDFARDRQLALDVEMKFSGEAPVEPLCDAVGNLLSTAGLGDRIMVTSFHHRALGYLKQRFPQQRIGRLYGDVAPDEAALGFDDRPQVAVLWSLVDDALMQRVRARGGAVHVWTVDDPAEMRRLIELGVATIMSNRPAVLQQVLETVAAAEHP